jgi:hypothetical protein
MRRAIVVMVVAVWAGGAQTTVNGGRDFKGTVKASGSASSVDFTGAASTAPAKAGTLAARPSGCSIGQVYFATDAAAGQNLSFCTSSGVWSSMTGGGSGSGSGVSYCAPASGSGTAYTCSPSPAIASYAAGVVLAFVPDVNGSGGATTVNVSGLGAKSIKQADGATNPLSTDLAAGKVYLLTYDGSVFRLELNATNAANITSGTLPDARLSTNVVLANGANTYTGYNNFSGGSWRPPESTVGNLPAAATVAGRVFLVTDAATAGACSSGGGTTREVCRSNGSNYECIGNCGTGGAGNPGGTNGQMQYNSNGSFAGQPFALSGSVFQRGVECSSGTVSYTALTASATSQEVTIVTGVPMKFRFLHMVVQEATQFASASVGSATVSAGRASVDTDLIPAFALKSASTPQNFWYDRPGTPVIGTGTYDLVLQFVGSGALGTGSATNFTAGSVYWEVCGFSVP